MFLEPSSLIDAIAAGGPRNDAPRARLLRNGVPGPSGRRQRRSQMLPRPSSTRRRMTRQKAPRCSCRNALDEARMAAENGAPEGFVHCWMPLPPICRRSDGPPILRAGEYACGLAK